MNRTEVMDQLSKLIENPNTTVGQLKALAKKARWEVFWGMRRPQPSVMADLKTGKVRSEKR